MKEGCKIIDLNMVNVFLLKGKNGFVLIDTGMGQHWERLESELISAGCLPDQLKLVVVTHGDFDHTGNCARLQEKYGTKIAMHQADSFIVENGMIEKREIRTLMGKLIMILAKWKYRKATFDKFKPDVYLEDGQNLESYGFDGKIIHLPGHTKGSIGILTPESDLFIGDTLTNMRKPDLSPFIDNYEELTKSLERLKKLNIKMVYPGHGKPFSGDNISKISI